MRVYRYYTSDDLQLLSLFYQAVGAHILVYCTSQWPQSWLVHLLRDSQDMILFSQAPMNRCPLLGCFFTKSLHLFLGKTHIAWTWDYIYHRSLEWNQTIFIDIPHHYFIDPRTAMHSLLIKSSYLLCQIYFDIFCLNPLHAKFFRVYINIYLHFMSLLHIDKTRVLKILPQVRQGPAYSTYHSISWLPMSWRRKEPGHQQPWYWPSETAITRSPHVKGLNLIIPKVCSFDY